MIRVIYNCQIPASVSIGKPAHFGHGMNIVIGKNTKMGNYINITHNVTIAAHTTIGDNFFIGPNAIIINPVTIGNNVMVGANTVVTKDIPNNKKLIGDKYYENI